MITISPASTQRTLRRRRRVCGSLPASRKRCRSLLQISISR